MIVLTKDYRKATMARAVPGAAWDREAGAFVVPAPTPRAAAVILKLFPDVGLEHPELAHMRDELLADVRPFDKATPWYEAHGKDFRARDNALRVMQVLRAKGWDLHNYQDVDLTYAWACLHQHGAYYLGWERGLGKTLGTCVLIDMLGSDATLVVAPNTAKDSVWGDALREFCPWVHTIILGNTKSKRDAALATARQLYDEGVPFVLVVHYEALAVVAGKTKTPKGKTQIGDGWTKLGIEWDLMVTDEDHRLANTKAQMYRAAKKVPRAKLLILSGSIIQNHLEELYSPHARAFPDRYTSAWRDWNLRYLDYVENGYAKVCVGVKPDMVEPMREELGVWMSYRRKEDELDLPPKQYVDLRVELSPGQRKVYDKLKAECLAQLPDGSQVKAQEGIAMMTRLRQVATGLDLLGEGMSDSTKLDVAIDLIMDAEDSEFVVFSWYKAAVHALADRLRAQGLEPFCVTGDTPHAARAEMIARFQSGEGRVFIGTLATLGESVNLQRANQVIRLDRSWNPMLNVQAEDRVFRQGQTRNVTITDLIAKDTVDELNVQPTLANKEALRAAILGGA